MEWENIILTGACFAAIAVVAYYFWKKSASQRVQIEELNKRIEAIELTFAPQPSHATLDKFFPISSHSNIPQTTNIYTYMPTNNHHIVDMTEIETKSNVSGDSTSGTFGSNEISGEAAFGGPGFAKGGPSSRSPQVDEHDLTPFVIKSNRLVDIEAITDYLLPVISSK